MKLWQLENDNVYRKSVAAKKTEKSCVQELKKLKKQSIAIFSDFEILIPIEVVLPKWRATNVIWQAEKKREKRKLREKKPKRKVFFCLE